MNLAFDNHEGLYSIKQTRIAIDFYGFYKNTAMTTEPSNGEAPALEDVEYSFMAITPRSTLNRSGNNF